MLFKDNIAVAIYFIVFFGSRIISSWKRGRRNALSGGEKQGVGGADRKLENIEWTLPVANNIEWELER